MSILQNKVSRSRSTTTLHEVPAIWAYLLSRAANPPFLSRPALQIWHVGAINQYFPFEIKYISPA